MKVIDYNDMLSNTQQIINALEFDSMRSAGKVKFNVATLNELYKLEATLQARLEKSKPTPLKPTKSK